jgi:hypothetical protein
VAKDKDAVKARDVKNSVNNLFISLYFLLVMEAKIINPELA